MAKYYGTLNGRGSSLATKTGTNFIKASAQSWDGSVITRLDHSDNKLRIRIDLANDSRDSMGTTYFMGSMEDLIECFEVYKKYKEQL